MEAVGVGDVLLGVSLVLWRAGGGYGLRKEDGREKVQSGRRAQVMVSWWGRKGTRTGRVTAGEGFRVQRAARSLKKRERTAKWEFSCWTVGCFLSRKSRRIESGCWFFFKYCQPLRWAMNLNLPLKDGNPLQLSRRERRERKKKDRGASFNPTFKVTALEPGVLI